jgi:dihydropteroate synthase
MGPRPIVPEETLSPSVSRRETEPTMQFVHSSIDLSRRVAVVGILNLTPDSFYDGGRYNTESQVLGRVEEMVEEGADIIDVGGESTRPCSEPVLLSQELSRVIPAIRSICARFAIPVSIDTYKAEVAKQALDAGAQLVNDISALRFDSKLASVVSEYGAYVVLMHLKGTPRSMQESPQYTDVMAEVMQHLAKRIEFARSSGIAQERIVIDPGIGFGKTTEHNLVILRKLSQLLRLRSPVMVGASRKSFLGNILGLPPARRLIPSVAAACVAVAAGARLIRCHDVAQTRHAVDLVHAVFSSPEGR